MGRKPVISVADGITGELFFYEITYLTFNRSWSWCWIVHKLPYSGSYKS
jgi:hypothetical protein